LPSSVGNTTTATTQSLADVSLPVEASVDRPLEQTNPRSYAEIFTGIRQDSGDPVEYVREAREFYDSVGIRGKKVLVFSDSLNIDRCLEYKKVAEEYGFTPSFGVGTFFTNDFVHKSDGKKSVPLNIVIKLSSAGGRPAIKISDNIGKTTGDSKTVEDVKHRLGYVEKAWANGNESKRWGKENEADADGVEG
jgi:nicotinate phosphoribosyltransferase